MPYLRLAGKVASWPIVLERPRLIGLLDSHYGRVGSGPAFALYDQPVSPALVEQHLVVTDRLGKRLRANAVTPQSVARVLDAEIDTRYVVAISIEGLPADGQAIVLSLPDWQEAGQRPKLSEFELEVSRTLELRAMRSTSDRDDDRLPQQARWELDFNNQVEPSRFQEALIITPEPISIDVSRTWNGQIGLGAELAPGVRYHLSTKPELTDVLGNRLAEPLDLRFQAADLVPVLSVPQLPVLVERVEPRLPIKVRNVDELSVELRRFESAAAFAKAMAVGHRSRCADYGLRGVPTTVESPRISGTPNTSERLDLPLAGGPGLFCVEVWASGRGSEAHGRMSDAVLVQSTDLGVSAKVFADTVLAWVTSLGDASPMAGVTIRLFDRNGAEISTGTAGRDGVVKLAAKGVAIRTGLADSIFLLAATKDDLSVTQLRDDQLSSPFQYGLEGEVHDTEKLDAVVFTERGVYRPGDTVHLKLILAAAGATPPQLQIQDPRGQQVIARELALDSFGSADLDLELKEQAPVGRYVVRLTRGRAVTVRTFSVEEYRVPSFRVLIAPSDQQRVWKRGDQISATVRAEYLHGGVLDGRQAHWQVWRQPQAFAPAGFPGFVFSLSDGSGLEGSIASGSDRLNAQGELAVSFRSEHPSSAGPMRYVLEAAVTDVDRQAYAGRISQVVHPADFYVGLRPPQLSVLGAGDTLTVPIVAIASDGKPIAGVEVRSRLERIDYHTTARMAADADVQLRSRPVPVDRDHCLVTTGQAPVTCSFTITEAGEYQVRAWAEDSEHRSVQAGFKITASGSNPAAWPRFDQDRIEVVADQPRYRAGDVARLIVQSPYEKARGLLTIERDQVLEHRLLTIDSDTPAIEVPIRAEHAPNVFVSVILVRGRVHTLKDASGYETGAPGFKMGYAELAVEPGEQRLAVKVEPAATTAHPGQSVRVGLTVRDSRGRPCPGQATVFVVDEAVLSLTGYRTPDPVAQLYAERPLGVRTGESRHELTQARRTRREQIFSASGDGGEFQLGDLPDEMRRLFKSTAYWNPNVVVGDDGSAKVEIELPDNTTTYRIMAVVTDSRSRVGADDSQVVVRKPLMVQPVLPRFVYPDDELQIEALVFNGTTAAGTVELAGELDGLAPPEGGVRGRTKVEPGRQGSFKFKVRVSGRDRATVRFAARLGEHSDAVEVTLPILGPGTRRTVVASRSITGRETISIDLPAERLPGTAKVEVVISSTVLSELKDAVQYLMGYPNGCIEQTTSTAYPLVVLRDLLPEIGVEVDQAKLKEYAEAGIRRILSFQTESGGLSYWPGGSQPHAFATAFGLTALIEGKKRGYDVPDEALAGMADYLEHSLRAGEITGEMPHGSLADGDTRALFVMTLGRLGRPQPAYVSTLWRERGKLTPFGLSFLAIAVKEMPGDQSLLGPILAAIREAAREEEREAWFEGDRRGGWSFDSPLRTQAGALLAHATAADTAAMSGKLLTGLLARRQYGLWGNTQENVFGIMGVHALTQRAGAAGEAPRMSLSVMGRKVADGDLEVVSQRVRRLSLTERDLGLSAGRGKSIAAELVNNGGTPVFLTLRAEYEVPLSEDKRRAQSQGFTISRRYETVDGDSLEGRPIPLGSLVRVRLQIDNPEHRNYVAIDDKLPAGLEPLNTNLETTETVAAGAFSATVQRSRSVLSYSEIRDARVAFYVDDMLPGEYEYSYVARATTPGAYLRPAGRVEAMYEPEIGGNTSIDTVEVQ